MKYRVTFQVPLGALGRMTQIAIEGAEYEADTFTIIDNGTLSLYGPDTDKGRKLLIAFAPGAWRTISPVLGGTEVTSSENPRRPQKK